MSGLSSSAGKMDKTCRRSCRAQFYPCFLGLEGKVFEIRNYQGNEGHRDGLFLEFNFLEFVSRTVETQRARGKEMIHTWRLMGLVASLGASLLYPQEVLYVGGMVMVDERWWSYGRGEWRRSSETLCSLVPEISLTLIEGYQDRPTMNLKYQTHLSFSIIWFLTQITALPELINVFDS